MTRKAIVSRTIGCYWRVDYMDNGGKWFCDYHSNPLIAYIYAYKYKLLGI